MQYCHLAPYPNHSVANAEKHCPVNGGQVWKHVLHVTVQGKVPVEDKEDAHRRRRPQGDGDLPTHQQS